MDLFSFDRACRTDDCRVLAGIDEAGRGPWAGPVVAAAVILPDDCIIPTLNDSKKLSPRTRDTLYDVIMAGARVGVGSVDAVRIDDTDILRATFAAMRAAVAQLDIPFDLVLVDGSLAVPALGHPQRALIGGDGASACIAAASVIAKVTRDRLMAAYALQYPQYNFHLHKGYGTAAHRAALDTFGPCPIHRKSFEPIKRMLREP